MKTSTRSFLPAVLLTLALSSFPVLAADLSSSFQLQTGDYVALALDSYVSKLKGWGDDPIAVSYDRTKKKIVVAILGGSISIDTAKLIVSKKGELLKKLEARSSAACGVTLAESDFVVNYMSGDKLLIGREDGKWVLGD